MISEDFGPLAGGEFVPLAGSEVGREVEFSNGDAHETEGGKTHGRGHFADLAITTFA